MLEQFFSEDGRNFRPSAIRAFSKLIKDPGVISFAGGMPSPETFPADELSEIAASVITDRRAISLQYGPTLGLPRLREMVSSICVARGMVVSAADVLMTTGSQQGLNLIAHAFIDPGDIVLVELPSYVGGLASFHGRRGELVGIRQDDGGIDLADLEAKLDQLRIAGRRVKLLYTIPNFQNPSGRLMQQDRRDQLLALSERFGFLIVEDDPYGELVYVDGAETTAIRAREGSERVIYLGSFSKVLAPGLRSGWVVAAPVLLNQLELAKEAADLCSAMLDQSIIEEFLARDLFERQLSRVRNFYRDRRNAFMQELETHFRGEASWTEAAGGLFTFVTLHQEIDTREHVGRAIEHGVAYVPGAAFFVDGSGGQTMRLTFAKEPDERMREGVRRLAEVFLGTRSGDEGSV
jgi:2-aminoadipate transaminase